MNIFSRRNFFIKILWTFFGLSLFHIKRKDINPNQNYLVSLFESIHVGTATAGAKTWDYLWGGSNGVFGCSGNVLCPLTYGPCTTVGARIRVRNCGCDAGREYMSATYECGLR